MHDCGDMTDYDNGGKVNCNLIDIEYNDNSNKYMMMSIVMIVSLMNSIIKNLARFSENNSTKI